jgi:outer membrane protein OmpA-like peptidoglycan-associated protein
MKVQILFVLACAASLFAQDISCRVSFDAVKNTTPRDAATNRIYALVEARIQSLEKIPAKDRSESQFRADLKTCELAVELFKVQLERTALAQKYADTQKEASRVKDSIIATWISEYGALGKALENERSLLGKSQRELALKEQELAAQKAEAQKKLEALNSKAISVYKDARGTILSMSDILFEFGKADLKSELKENLAEIAAILKNLLTESKVVVEGHTDNVGKDASNKKLSEHRAGAVMQYLVDRGVDKKRLSSVGYGATKPVAENKTEEGRAKNRRVELVIKDK